jgi:hypothetical protein
VPFWSFLENFQALGFWVVVSTFECCGWVLLFSRAYPEENAMSRVYVGNLDPRATERELEDEFRVYGVLRSVWVARKPPGFAFVEFDDLRDAQDAIRAMDGEYLP